MSNIPPNSLLPSGYMIAIFDNNGNSKILESPTLGNALLYWNGTTFAWYDGSDDLPLVLTNMPENSGTMKHILATSMGRIYPFIGPDAQARMLVSQNQQVTWQLITGQPPTTGFGFLVQPAYTPPAATPPLAFLSTTGLPYQDATIGPSIIGNGNALQLLTMVNGKPTWANPPSGTVSSGGVSGSGLANVSANNTNASTVNVVVPSITLTKADATTYTASSVNVSANLAASLGPGGLDVGAETANTWYYVYVISDGTNVNAVISTSNIVPDLTNLGAYVYQGLASILRNDNSSNIVKYYQRGRDFYVTQQVWIDPASVTTSYNAITSGVNLNTLIPPSVKTVTGNMGGSASATVDIELWIAGDNTGMGQQSLMGNTGSSGATTFNNFRRNWGSFVRVPIINPASPSLFWVGNANDAHRRVEITGYSI